MASTSPFSSRRTAAAVSLPSARRSIAVRVWVPHAAVYGPRREPKLLAHVELHGDFAEASARTGLLEPSTAGALAALWEGDAEDYRLASARASPLVRKRFAGVKLPSHDAEVVARWALKQTAIRVAANNAADDAEEYAAANMTAYPFAPSRYTSALSPAENYVRARAGLMRRVLFRRVAAGARRESREGGAEWVLVCEADIHDALDGSVAPMQEPGSSPVGPAQNAPASPPRLAMSTLAERVSWALDEKPLLCVVPPHGHSAGLLVQHLAQCHGVSARPFARLRGGAFLLECLVYDAFEVCRRVMATDAWIFSAPKRMFAPTTRDDPPNSADGGDANVLGQGGFSSLASADVLAAPTLIPVKAIAGSLEAIASRASTARISVRCHPPRLQRALEAALLRRGHTTDSADAMAAVAEAGHSSSELMRWHSQEAVFAVSCSAGASVPSSAADDAEAADAIFDVADDVVTDDADVAAPFDLQCVAYAYTEGLGLVPEATPGVHDQAAATRAAVASELALRRQVSLWGGAKAARAASAGFACAHASMREVMARVGLEPKPRWIVLDLSHAEGALRGRSDVLSDTGCEICPVQLKEAARAHKSVVGGHRPDEVGQARLAALAAGEALGSVLFPRYAKTAAAEMAGSLDAGGAELLIVDPGPTWSPAAVARFATSCSRLLKVGGWLVAFAKHAPGRGAASSRRLACKRLGEEGEYKDIIDIRLFASAFANDEETIVLVARRGPLAARAPQGASPRSARRPRSAGHLVPYDVPGSPAAARRLAAEAVASASAATPSPRASGAVTTGVTGSPGRMMKAGAYAWQDHRYLPPPAYYHYPLSKYDDKEVDHERPYLRYWDPYGVWRYPYRRIDAPYPYGYPYAYPPYHNSPFAPSPSTATAAAAAAGAAAARATAEALSPQAERDRVRRVVGEAERAMLRAGHGISSPTVMVKDGLSMPRRSGHGLNF